MTPSNRPCRRARLPLFAIFCLMSAAMPLRAQYLYPEHYPYDDSTFCLDCGDLKAQYPADYPARLASAFGRANMTKQVQGPIFVQLMVYQDGSVRLVSADNRSGIPSRKLRLDKAFASIPWHPARPAQRVSVCLRLQIQGGQLYVQRINLQFDPANMAPAPDGPAQVDTALSYTIQTFAKPAMATRSDGIAAAPDGTIWIGSHNGLGCYRDSAHYHTFTCKNSPLDIDPFYNRTYWLHTQAADSRGRLWSVQGYNLFLLSSDSATNNFSFTRFDTLNSPVDWPRTLFVDSADNLWETDWDGIHRYDGARWHTYDSSNYPLPTSKMLSFYIDRQGRQWIGTWAGNVLIDGDSATQLSQGSTPFAKGYISNTVQDSRGNLWFTFTCGKWKHYDGVLLMLDAEGQFHELCPRGMEHLAEECCNDLLYDATRDQLWVSINSVGLLLYDIPTGRWELYTPDNSLLPSGYIMQLAQAPDGSVWGASFGGAFKIVK